MTEVVNSQVVRLELHNQDDERKVRHKQLLPQWNLPKKAQAEKFKTTKKFPK